MGDALDGVHDAYLRMSLQLQQAFVLRREESIKFQPGYTDRGNHIALKGSWTKGGRERTVPITMAEQWRVLETAHRLAGSGSLIPANTNYIQQRHTYDGQCKGAGLSNMHGLRHRYARDRYEALTGWKAPAASGPSTRLLTPAQRALDAQARQAISLELGMSRRRLLRCTQDGKNLLPSAASVGIRSEQLFSQIFNHGRWLPI
ncbi:Fis family transcriptional regulator [Burkholderia aenigmatica]|uniref:Fis family transcriptional regulator n=1 Tax=Burkholderia aenigmatica TaxID=2015348 RepID=A0ABY6XUL6_9BURK|nr:integrase domain-containing protein [Burkholderia aenigmatica]VWC85041.1 Fis family transcriptional regulator [Burkholderia aenigmatica]